MLISTAPDRDLTNLSQKIRFKIWTVYEVGTRYEHLKCGRVLHNNKSEITPKPKFLRVVLHSMGLPNSKPALTPSVAGSVKHKPDDDVDLDMQECRDSTVDLLGSLQYLSIDRCDVHFGTHACGKDMKQPTKASWTRLKRLARYLAANPVSES